MENIDVRKKLAAALDALGDANNMMIDAIEAYVLENSKNGEVTTIYVTIDESCGYSEEYIVEFDENNSLVLVNDNFQVVGYIEDMTADELFDVCVKLNK